MGFKSQMHGTFTRNRKIILTKIDQQDVLECERSAKEKNEKE